ncbi:Lrp/AsnC family transcriptional regulator [Puia sp. P3]|uniref:Lrp/AsnC family transcriptional regulator n=1 Tax=Puia sp. P3 TaxID=3423952 RepID=UPI003D66D34C
MAILDGRKLERGLIAFSHVLLTDHTKETLDQFEKTVTCFPEVMECFQMTGTVDFILRIATVDMEAYRDFYRNKLATLPNISTVQSYFVLSDVKAKPPSLSNTGHGNSTAQPYPFLPPAARLLQHGTIKYNHAYFLRLCNQGCHLQYPPPSTPSSTNSPSASW